MAAGHLFEVQGGKRRQDWIMVHLRNLWAKSYLWRNQLSTSSVTSHTFSPKSGWFVHINMFYPSLSALNY